MAAEGFLSDLVLRPFQFTQPSELEPLGLALGQGAGGLEVAIARAPRRPGHEALRRAWQDRQRGRAAPLVLVVLYGDRAAVCGPAGDVPPVLADLDPGQVERICRAALDEPNRHAALRFLWGVLPEVKECRIPGLRNQGLFATHELEVGVPKRPDWPEAQRQAQPLLARRGRVLLEGLGFEILDTPQPYSILCARTPHQAGEAQKVAVAIFLDRSEAADLPAPRFHNTTPIQYALAKADEQHLDYVLVDHGSSLRIHSTSGQGVGRRGRTETFLEIHLDLIPTEHAGYLWLLFSAPALCPGSSFQTILQDSYRYASDLGSRLRDRVYEHVLPQLATALAQARNLRHPSFKDLAETYEMALLVLFRLLFIAYAEDKDLLPYRSNELYRQRSLKQKARQLAEQYIRQHGARAGEAPVPGAPCFASPAGCSLWDQTQGLFACIATGQPQQWGVPAYDGALFSADPAVLPAGAALAKVRLPDEQFAPVLFHLLVDPLPEAEGAFGPVDFRSLGVREFGTIYEGLLESELSVAEEDLVLDEAGSYVPLGARRGRSKKPQGPPHVRAGQFYLHDRSGARKATGSYYTKDFAVEYLLDQALEPALADHLARLDTLDDRQAAEALFDFRVADLAMGSGHFLVAAVDRIERRLSTYLARRPLAGVLQELHRLRSKALEGLRQSGGSTEGLEIDNNQLLRRQIARRSIYGVDLNPIAVHLARLSLWIHTFVPGLPLSFLDRNILEGNSLVGIATFDEVDELLKEGTTSPDSHKGAKWILHRQANALIGSTTETIQRLARLSDADAAEIRDARKAFEQQKQLVAPTARMFDILTASRLPEADIHVTAEDFDTENQHNCQDLHRRALEALGQLRPFHFPLAFPEVFLRPRPGFDCILGNPPWEKAKLEEDGFWSRYVPGFQALPQHDQEAVKKRYRRNRPDLLRQFQSERRTADALRRALVSGPYPGMGTGDPDVYKAFCWRFWNLVRHDGGRIGVVLPRSALCAKGSSAFRTTVLEQATLDVTFLVNNRQWVFPEVHPQYTIGLTCITRGQEPVVRLRGPFASLERFEAGARKPPASFAAPEVRTWTDTAALPLLAHEDSAEVFAQIRKAPRLDLDDGRSWRARPYRELDATNDKRLMKVCEDCPQGYWPVFKGESFDLWEPDRGVYYAWAHPEKIIGYLHKKRKAARTNSKSPFFEFADPQWFATSDTLPCHFARIALRDVTNRTNRRTVVVALLPPKCFLTNAAPYLLWPRGDEKDQAFLLGVLSSIPLDWYARRFVETHVNYHVLNPFPIPRPPRQDPRWQRVVVLAGRLASPDRRFARWAKAVGVEYGKLDPAAKDDMIAELDALVAHLYGLNSRQLVHIFETFHEGWDYQARLDAVLVHYRRWVQQAGQP